MSESAEQIVMESEQMKETLERMASAIVEQAKDRSNLVIVGIHTGGVHLAGRLREMIQKRFSLSIPLGALDINLYRDDWTRLHKQPLVRSTDLPFDIEDREVILVDDVLYTGRTIRAALGALVDYGRPERVQLAVMVDRGHRELPICPQFTGIKVDTTPQQQVNVHLVEKDGFDRIVTEGLSSEP
jgi:pyrimidine operon attenuation protein/uracil phosphoribosyltransferase